MESAIKIYQIDAAFFSALSSPAMSFRSLEQIPNLESGSSAGLRRQGKGTKGTQFETSCPSPKQSLKLC